MTSVGAAVGLGNIWGFPYRVCRGGGFVFIAVYCGFVLLIGVPLMHAELKLGRAFRTTPIMAYKLAGGGFAGYIGLTACFIVLSYYFHFGGMILREIALTCGVKVDNELFWHVLFAAITVFIVLSGVNGGVEKCSKIMVPALIVVLGILAVYALTSSEDRKAIEFLFVPDTGRFNADTIKSALGQALFSLSLGQCIMVTFGAYLKKDESLVKYVLAIPFLDTFVALLASLVVIPLVFKTGSSISNGPTLLFETLPVAFRSIKGGKILSLAFFIPVLFAAITSAISLLDVPASAISEEKGISRKKACIYVAFPALLLGLPLCVSIRFFALYETVSEKILMTSCSLITCLLFITRKRNSLPELAPKGKAERLFTFILRFITPAILLLSTVI